VTPGRASQRLSTGKAARQAASPCRLRFAASVASTTANFPHKQSARTRARHNRGVLRDAEAEAEELMILERLLAIQELRKETRRLEEEGGAASGSDVRIPSGWLDLLAEGLAMAIEDAESGDSERELSDRECRERVERTRWLAQAIRDTVPDCALSVSPDYHEALRDGVYGAFRKQKVSVMRLVEHYDPHGLHFIVRAQLVAIYGFTLAFDGVLEE
jgi:hypothetical protein